MKIATADDAISEGPQIEEFWYPVDRENGYIYTEFHSLNQEECDETIEAENLDADSWLCWIVPVEKGDSK